MNINYSEKSVKQIKRISKGNKKVSQMILNRIEDFADNPAKQFDIKTLKGKFGDLKRLRVRDYRIIFEIIASDIFIYEIKHRKDAYND